MNSGSNPPQTPTLCGATGSGASDKWDEEGLKRFYRAFVKHQQNWSKVRKQGVHAGTRVVFQHDLSFALTQPFSSYTTSDL